MRGDEVGERTSGLTPGDALANLHEYAIQAYQAAFSAMRFKIEMSTRLAAETAAELVRGLYSDVFAQVDPLRLGELDRANRIAVEYGKRLLGKSQNTKEDGALARLVVAYPSHGFVIDREEAQTIFKNVRKPTLEEQRLALRFPVSETSAFVSFASTPPPEPPQEQNQCRRTRSGRSSARRLGKAER